MRIAAEDENAFRSGLVGADGAFRCLRNQTERNEQTRRATFRLARMPETRRGRALDPSRMVAAQISLDDDRANRRRIFGTQVCRRANALGDVTEDLQHFTTHAEVEIVDGGFRVSRYAKRSEYTFNV